MSGNGRFLAVADSLDARLFVFDLQSDVCRTAAVDSGAVRVRYAVSVPAWYVLSIGGSRIQVVTCTDDTLAVSDSISVEPTVSDFVIWE